MPKGRLFLEGGGDVTVLGHATCQILPCSATLLLARLLLAPRRSPRDICLPSLLYIPFLLLLSLVSSLDSNPQALVQRHLCEPSQPISTSNFYHQSLPLIFTTNLALFDIIKRRTLSK